MADGEKELSSTSEERQAERPSEESLTELEQRFRGTVEALRLMAENLRLYLLTHK